MLHCKVNPMYVGRKYFMCRSFGNLTGIIFGQIEQVLSMHSGVYCNYLLLNFHCCNLLWEGIMIEYDGNV